MEFELKRKVILYEGKSRVWHMLFLPKGLSRDLKKFFAGMEGGFKSLPVEITIGQTSWKTSIFPDSKEGAFLLLLKAAVRKKENIAAGDIISFKLKILI